MRVPFFSLALVVAALSLAGSAPDGTNLVDITNTPGADEFGSEWQPVGG